MLREQHAVPFLSVHTMNCSIRLPLCRAREGVNENDVSVHVCIFLFDILLLQGDILLRKAFRERRRALSGVFTALKPGHVALAQSYELHVCAQEAESQTQEAPPELGVNGAPITEVKIMTVRTTCSQFMCVGIDSCTCRESGSPTI